MTDSDAVRRKLDMLADEELVAILRDRDEGQWRPEVFDIVASILESRGISARDVLAAGTGEPEQDQEEPSFSAPRETITAAVYFDSLEAHTDRLALEQAGIRAWVVDGYSCTPDGIGARLQILPEDLAAAMEIIEAQQEPASALPPESADLSCPRCGSMKVSEVDEVLDVLDASSASPTRGERRVCFCRCDSCKHEWTR